MKTPCMTAAWIMSCAVLGCGSPAPKTEAQYKQELVDGMHASLLVEIETLRSAAVELRDAAPTPQGRGWDAAMDANAIRAMKEHWTRGRTAYERVEGALATLFPEIDFAIDARYDDFLTVLATRGGDDNLFDDTGVTGFHAVERILWSDGTPSRVVDFEAALPGYCAAAFPASAQEASDFKNKLCERAIADVTTLRDQWSPAKIDLAGALDGLIALMNEQGEKVNKAATNEEESRYSQRTMVDIRDNLAGTIRIYQLFEPLLIDKGGAETDLKIMAGFDALSAAYAQPTGDAIPAPPPTWDASAPSAADLESAFGQLYSAVKSAVDPARDGSIVFEMNRAAVTMGFPGFTN